MSKIVAKLIGALASVPRVVPLLMMVVAVGHFNRIGITVAGSEQIIKNEGLTPDQMGLVYSAFLLFYTLAMLPGGWFIDRFGARTAIICLGVGSTALIALTGLAGFAGGNPMLLLAGLLVARSLLGIVNAPLHPAAARTVFENVPPKSKAFANGIVTFAACVGISATYVVFGKLMDKFGWPTAFLVTSTFTLVMTCVWILSTQNLRAVRKDPHPRALGTWLGPMSSMLGRRSILCISISYGAYGYFQYLFFYWINYYAETIRHLEPEVSRGYSTQITLAMGVGMALGGWLSDRVPHFFSPKIRRGAVPVMGMICSGLVFEVGLLLSNPDATLVAFAISALLLGTCEGAYWTTVVELGGRYGGTAGGFMNTIGNMGGTISPWLTPVLSTAFAGMYGQETGWKLSLAIAGAIVILGAGLWYWVDPREAIDGSAETVVRPTFDSATEGVPA